MDDIVEQNLPFAFTDTDDLPASLSDGPSNPIPFTLVNSRPLDHTPFVAPYVPVNPDVAYSSLVAAAVSATDTLVDLGCGDARILVQALDGARYETPPARAVGVELDPYLAAHVRKTHAPLIEAGKLDMIEADMFSVDLEAIGATVLVLYLLPDGLEKLKPLLGRWLQGGRESLGAAGSGCRRVVTITYSVPGWEPVQGSLSSTVVREQGGFMGGSSTAKQWLFRYEAKSVV